MTFQGGSTISHSRMAPEPNPFSPAGHTPIQVTVLPPCITVTALQLLFLLCPVFSSYPRSLFSIQQPEQSW